LNSGATGYADPLATAVSDSVSPWPSLSARGELVRGKASLWRIAAAGSAPAFAADLESLQVRTIEVTRDGRHVIFDTDSGFTLEVWASTTSCRCRKRAGDSSRRGGWLTASA